MQAGQLNEFLKARGIDRSSLVNQVTASIVWAKLVRRQAAQTIEISDEEIDDALKRLKEHAGRAAKPRRRDLSRGRQPEPGRGSPAAGRKADRADEAGRPVLGGRAAILAIGDGGGRRRYRLGPAGPAAAPNSRKAVAPLQARRIVARRSATGGGYYLLLVLDRRTGNAGGRQQDTGLRRRAGRLSAAAAGRPKPMRQAAALAEAKSIRAAAKNCAEHAEDRQGKGAAAVERGQGRRRAALPPQLRDMVTKLPIGAAVAADRAENGVGVIMVCAKDDPAAESAGEPTPRRRVRIAARGSGSTRVARRYLRDLRRAAYVDVQGVSAMALPLALTMGEPAGIGGEIALKAWLRRARGRAAVLPDRRSRPAGRAGAARSAGMCRSRPIAERRARPCRLFADALPVLPLGGTPRAAPGQPDPADAPAGDRRDRHRRRAMCRPGAPRRSSPTRSTRTRSTAPASAIPATPNTSPSWRDRRSRR